MRGIWGYVEIGYPRVKLNISLLKLKIVLWSIFIGVALLYVVFMSLLEFFKGFNSNDVVLTIDVRRKI